MKEHKIIQKFLLLLYIAAVAYLCFGKFEDLPQVSKTLFGIPTDKLVHFAMFFPFPILMYWAFDWKTDRVWKSFLLSAFFVGLGLLISLGTELVQGLTTYRSKDILDFAADSMSVGLSSVFVLIVDIIKNLKNSPRNA